MELDAIGGAHSGGSALGIEAGPGGRSPARRHVLSDPLGCAHGLVGENQRGAGTHRGVEIVLGDLALGSETFIESSGERMPEVVAEAAVAPGFTLPGA